MKAKTAVPALVAVLLLAACGNKGPLVLPPKPAPVEQGVPVPADDLDEDEDDQDG